MPSIYILKATGLPKPSQIYYTSLRSANRAAYAEAVQRYRANVGNFYEEAILDDFREEWREAKETDDLFCVVGTTDQSGDVCDCDHEWSVDVIRLKAEGPDFEKGERDAVVEEGDDEDEDFQERKNERDWEEAAMKENLAQEMRRFMENRKEEERRKREVEVMGATSSVVTGQSAKTKRARD